MRLIACSLVFLALAACAKPLHGPIIEGQVSGLVSRGRSLPAVFKSETIDLRTRHSVLIKSADFDRDGDLDLLTYAYSSIPKIFWNDGEGHFEEFIKLEALGKPDEVCIADLDADGDPDLVTGDWSGGIYLAYNDGYAGFRQPEPVDPQGGPVRHITAADWDGQAGVEVIWFSDRPAGIHCASLIDGNWTIRPLAANWSSDFFNEITVADVNMDDRPDLVLIGSNTMLIQPLDGGLREHLLEDEGQRILAAGDFDEDGRADMLVCGAASPLTIMSQSATGRWEEQGSFPLYGVFPLHWISAQIADLDADGRDDLCIQQNGFYNMGCWGGTEGWESPSNWQVLLRGTAGWQLRESKPVDGLVYYPGVIARIDLGPYPDLIVPNEDGPGYCLVRDPFRP